MRELHQVEVLELAPGARVLTCRSLETGDEATIITAPIKLTKRQRWSWAANDVIELPLHGLMSSYLAGCRCADCVQAARAYWRDSYRRKCAKTVPHGHP